MYRYSVAERRAECDLVSPRLVRRDAGVPMPELSDANLRAVLLAIVRRNNGVIEIGNAELYDAMLPTGGAARSPFRVEETPTGIRVTHLEVTSEDQAS